MAAAAPLAAACELGHQVRPIDRYEFTANLRKWIERHAPSPRDLATLANRMRRSPTERADPFRVESWTGA